MWKSLRQCSMQSGIDISKRKRNHNKTKLKEQKIFACYSGFGMIMSALSDIKREAKPSVVYLIKHELRVL